MKRKKSVKIPVCFRCDPAMAAAARQLAQREKVTFNSVNEMALIQLLSDNGAKLKPVLSGWTVEWLGSTVED
jgi:hypothetical protein